MHQAAKIFKTPERDKPLSFHWRAADPSWIDDLDLPESRSAKRDAARSAILVDAALTGIAEPDRWISYARANGWWSTGQRYRGSAFTRSTVLPAIDELAALGLVDSQKAEPGPRPPGTQGRQSRFRATPALIAAARPKLVSPTTGAPTVIYDPGETIRLKDAEGRLIDYDDTRRTEAMRWEMTEFNEALRATEINLLVDDAQREGQFLRLGDAVLNQAVDIMHRVFSRGSFACHGRLYGPWWQGLPKEYRAQITINGEATVELDYGNQHLHMVYAEAGVSMGDGDAYDIDGWPRPLVKVAIFALINARDENGAVGVICDAREREIAITGPRAHERARMLIEDIKRRHGPVAHLFHRDQGIRLMRRDSELVTSIMRSMLRLGVPILPIHDSFIIDERYAGQLREQMEAAWCDQIGAESPFITSTSDHSVLHMAPGAPVGCAFGPVPGLLVVVSVGSGDLFGGRPVPVGFWGWSSGTPSVEIRRFLRDEMQDRCFLGSDLAREVGISRPQLVNLLIGRFGTTPRVAQALKRWALEGRYSQDTTDALRERKEGR